jgi:uncharacterized FlgJ-related protein
MFDTLMEKGSAVACPKTLFCSYISLINYNQTYKELLFSNFKLRKTPKITKLFCEKLSNYSTKGSNWISKED